MTTTSFAWPALLQQRWFWITAAVLALTACASSVIGQNQPSSPNSLLIKLGSDMPSTWELKTLMPNIDSSPFDGVVIRLPQGNRTFSATAFPDSDYAAQAKYIQDAKTIAPSSKYQNSFLLLWITPYGAWDWFDDAHWEATEKNLRNLAKVVKASGVKGIFFDQEPYSDTRPWGFDYQPSKNTRDFAAHSVQARKRGQQFIKAIQEEAPGLTLFTTRFFSIPSLLELWKKNPNATQADADAVLVKDNFYGLWPAFAKGIMDGVASDVKIIDGNELSYYHPQANLFDEDVRVLTTPPAGWLEPAALQKYKAQVQVGHAIYPDGILNPSNNLLWLGYFLEPEERWSWLEHNVYHALKSAKGYTFYYSEEAFTGNWWNPSAALAPTVKRMDETVRRARGKLARGEDLGFSIDPFMQGDNGAIAKYNARVKFAGFIRRADGTGIENVVINSSTPDISCKDTNKFGLYTCVAVGGWSGVLTPTKSGSTFTPTNRTYQNLSKDQFGQGFSGSP
jgi:hypothetical protein